MQKINGGQVTKNIDVTRESGKGMWMIRAPASFEKLDAILVKAVQVIGTQSTNLNTHSLPLGVLWMLSTSNFI